MSPFRPGRPRVGCPRRSEPRRARRSFACSSSQTHESVAAQDASKAFASGLAMAQGRVRCEECCASAQPRARAPRLPSRQTLALQRRRASRTRCGLAAGLQATASPSPTGLRLQRETMEDCGAVRALSSGYFYAGVFDGHGGDQVATFLRDHLHEACDRGLTGGGCLAGRACQGNGTFPGPRGDSRVRLQMLRGRRFPTVGHEGDRRRRARRERR